MNRPKVSIITVTYNVVDTIEMTIQSVLNQTYPNIEYIIVDGMSVDGTWEKICKYKDNIQCLIHEPDKGLYDAMNKGIEIASGEFVGMINGDDWYETDAVSKIINRSIENKEIEIFYGDMNITQLNGDVTQVGKRQVDDLWVTMIAHPTVFVRKSVYERLGKFNLNYHIAADYEMILRFYAAGVKFCCLEDVLANFRQGGLTTRRRMDCAKEVFAISLKYLDKCPDYDKYEKLIYDRYYTLMFNYILEQDEKKFKCSLEKLIGDSGLCIFGAGYYGRKFEEKIRICGIKCSMILDNDINKQGEVIGNISIRSIKSIDEWIGYVLITTINYWEIKTQIEQRNNKYIHIIDLADWDC